MTNNALMRDSLYKAYITLRIASSAHSAMVIVKAIKDAKYHMSNAQEEMGKALADGSLK
jgi:hypothetical protein